MRQVELELPEREPEIAGYCAACSEPIYENEVVWKDGDCLIHADTSGSREENCLKAWIEQACMFEIMAEAFFTKENAAL